MQAEGDSIKYEFILTTDLVDINRGKPLLGHTPDCDVDPYVAFLSPVGRTVWYQEHLRAGFGEAFNRSAAQDFGQNGAPGRDAAKVGGAGPRSRREHTLFVEHAIVRQIDLVAQRGNCAAFEKSNGVVQLSGIQPGRANQ